MAPPNRAWPDQAPVALKWYFSISEASLLRPEHDWPGLIRAAVSSARQNTSLRPHLLYDGGRTPFIDELEAHGVKVMRHRVGFCEAFAVRGASYAAVASGVFLRSELPLIETEEQYVLCTDCDVIFLSEPLLPPQPPEFFAAASQMARDDYRDMNMGVVVMNLPAMRRELPEFIRFIKDHINAGFPGIDQVMYRRFYQDRWDPLAPTMNWKPYWGIEPGARILHWHGPKPVWVRDRLSLPDLPTNADWRALFSRNRQAYIHYLKVWEQYGRMPRETVHCVVTIASAGVVAGWALDKADPVTPVRLIPVVDGQRLDEIVCCNPRPAVKKAGYPSESVGYRWQLPDRYRDGRQHRLALLNTRTAQPVTMAYAGGWVDHIDLTGGA
jgi:hypothetical protein